MYFAFFVKFMRPFLKTTLSQLTIIPGVRVQWRMQTFRWGEGRGGGGSSRPWEKGWGRSQKKIFRAPSGPEFGLQIREAPPLDPPLALDMRWQIANDGYNHLISNKREWNNFFFYKKRPQNLDESPRLYFVRTSRKRQGTSAFHMSHVCQNSQRANGLD